MDEERKEPARCLPTDLVREVFIRLGSIREVARCLRTCTSWQSTTRPRFFWLMVVRRNEEATLEKTMIRISLGSRWGHKGPWEMWSFVRCHGSSMATFLQNMRQKVTPEHMMTRLSRHSVMFDTNVVIQMSLAGAVCVETPLRDVICAQFANKICMEGGGMWRDRDPFCRVMDIRDEAHITIRIVDETAWCLWNAEAIQRIGTLEISSAGSTHFFSQWKGVDDARLEEIKTTKGGRLSDEFMLVASTAISLGLSFMPYLKRISWLDIPFSSVDRMWRVVAELACEIFPDLEEMRLILTIDEPFETEGCNLREWKQLMATFNYDFEAETIVKRWEPGGEKLQLLEFLVSWEVPLEVRSEFEAQLSIFGQFLASKVVVSVLY